VRFGAILRSERPQVKAARHEPLTRQAQRRRITAHVVEEGLRHSVRIGDAIDFEVEDPFGIETGEPARLTGVFHPVASELTAAEATRSQISAFGIEYEGKTGLSAAFSLAA
jgi:hypothetical protein